MDVRGERGWSGPAGDRERRPFSWRAVVWAVVYPQRGQRTFPTVTGLILIGLALGIGTAAYNSSSNILFITLSLLLACLVLSGVLSWINFRGVAWRLRAPGPWRVGQEGRVLVEVAKRGGRLPSYGLGFAVEARAVEPPERQRAEATLRASGPEVRAILAQVADSRQRVRLPLPGRLAPGQNAVVEWPCRPRQRGHLRVELVAVGSLFPFGFLRKEITASARREAIVWPATIPYERCGVEPGHRGAGSERAAWAGGGSDLVALRRYATGDSHRLIHWKASARTGRLLVRQCAAEVAAGHVLWFEAEAARWPRPEQFERGVSLAATLAEDLFLAGGLAAVALAGEAPRPVRSGHDLAAFLDRLASVAPQASERAGSPPALGRRRLITISPDGPAGVVAWMDGARWAVA